MNIESYNPQSDRYIVFESLGNPVEEIPSILSAFLLSLLANYNFRINGLDKNYLAEIFGSDVPWWGTEWKDYTWKHGYWNLRNLNIDEIKILKSDTIRNYFYNTQILHFYGDSDIMDYILENENYKEGIKIFDFKNDKTIYIELLKVLFSKIEDEYRPTVEFLKEELSKYSNTLVIRVDSKTDLDKIKPFNSFDFIYVSCENFEVYNKIKTSLPDMNFKHLKSQYEKDVNAEKSTKTLKMIELYFLSFFDEIVDFRKDNYGKFLTKLISPTQIYI